MRALREQGLRIPQDFSVIAIGTQEMLELAQPALTYLRLDLEGMGRQAGQLMLQRLRDGDTLTPQRVDVATDLVLQASCGLAPQA